MTHENGGTDANGTNVDYSVYVAKRDRTYGKQRSDRVKLMRQGSSNRVSGPIVVEGGLSERYGCESVTWQIQRYQYVDLGDTYPQSQRKQCVSCASLLL